MKAWLYLCVLCACGTETGVGDDSGDDTVDPPEGVSALERCLFDGGTLGEAWSAGNQHGPVTAITAGEIVVLGSADGSVKQWSVDGAEALYGTPFVTAGQSVAALAMSDGGDVLAGTEQGQLFAWAASDATETYSSSMELQLGAVAYGDRIIAGTTAGQVYAIDPVTDQVTMLESTLWGTYAVGFGPGDALYSAGHNYGAPQIERRSATSPTTVVEAWKDQSLGNIRALAGNDDVLVAAGEHFVAVFSPTDLSAPRVVKTPAGHDVVGVVLFPGGTRFATAGREGTLRIWETATVDQITTLTIPTPVGVASDTAGEWLYTSGPDGRLRAFGCTNGG